MNKKQMLESVKNYISKFDGDYKEILGAMKSVDRKYFVSKEFENSAYVDNALPTTKGQTISQPSTVARMIQILNLKKGERVLEIGTGSGWNASLIAHIIGDNGKVVSTEVFEELAEIARKNIKKASVKNVEVVVKDFRKFSGNFDKIIFTAGISGKEQEELISDFAKASLNTDGILVCPHRIGPFLVIKKQKNEKIKKSFSDDEYVFVPLLS